MATRTNNGKRITRALLIALVALFCALGSSAVARTRVEEARQATADANAPTSFREVTDETGRKVRVPVAAKRIVSLAPSVTETIYALGLQDRLVGDTDFCDYPADAMKKHKVGGAINPNLEEIAALHPDLVVMTKSLNRIETLNALEQLGIPVYGTDPRTVEEIVASSKRLGEVLGAPEAGATLAEELERRLTDLKQHLANAAAKRVLFVVWTEPLISIGQHTFVADALRHAGATSIVDSRQDWPQMSLEEVVHQQPDYLVFASSHSEGVVRDFEALAKRPGWDLLEAVKKRRFVVISDAVNRTAPRIVDAIEELAHQIQPQAFSLPAPEKTKEQAKPNATSSRTVFAGCSGVETEAACVR